MAVLMRWTCESVTKLKIRRADSAAAVAIARGLRMAVFLGRRGQRRKFRPDQVPVIRTQILETSLGVFSIERSSQRGASDTETAHDLVEVLLVYPQLLGQGATVLWGVVRDRHADHSNDSLDASQAIS
ncbi:hypothetical protein BI380_10285 [Delftia tsuruhatensis]|uniref:Transposase n=1 Tax=Delftia tsuruhatensis TaxID=180282 RepID=A0ABM6E2X4_9BURK|nr:hypothetical protein BI380_10285 [Delftia tsuruhatensis]